VGLAARWRWLSCGTHRAGTSPRSKVIHVARQTAQKVFHRAEQITKTVEHRRQELANKTAAKLK
jgi:hypothetical protein